MLTRVTDTIIEELIFSTCGEQTDPRRKHWMTHALHSLVRMAQAEQLQQMRRDVDSATGGQVDRLDDVSLTGCGSATTRRT
jgi:hypothetical protein